MNQVERRPVVGDMVKLSGQMISPHQVGDIGEVKFVLPTGAYVIARGKEGGYYWSEMEIIHRKEEDTQDEEVKIKLTSMKTIRQSVVTIIKNSLKEE